MTFRFLKNGVYTILLIGIFTCSYQLFNWLIYPWIQILICLIIPLSSLFISELIKAPKKEIRLLILIGTLCQLALSLIILLNQDLVVNYWRIIFFPSIYILLVLAYAISLRREDKYQTLFKAMFFSILTISLLRFFFYHQFIDYAIEILFLVYIILIFRAGYNKDNIGNTSTSKAI